MQSIREYWGGNKPPVVMTVVPERTYAEKPRDQMLAEAEQVLRNWGRSGANLPPAFFADFGTVSMARAWGGAVRRGAEGKPYLDPVAESVDEAIHLEPGPSPDANAAVEMYHELRRRTGIDRLGFKTPDFQGVLNTAAMVCREEQLLIAMHTEPAKVHRFLEGVCDHLVATVRDLQARVGRTDGNIWPYVWVPQDVGVCLTEDLMPLLSAEMYKEFGLPYLKRIADAFGGVYIHCCGRWGQHAENLGCSGINILGMEYHHPFTTAEQIVRHLPGVVLTPYLADFADQAYAGYVDFLADVMDVCRGTNPLWIAASDELLPADELREALAGRGAAEGFSE